MSAFNILPFLIPIILIQLGLQIFSLFDLFKADRQVKGGNKAIWVLVILLGNLLGVLVYLMAGRENE